MKTNITGVSLALIWILAAAFPYGCSNSPFNGLQEGKIIYDVTYDNGEVNPMVKAMRPSEVITYFSNNKTCTVIIMGLNMVEARLISDAAKLQYTTLISAMGKKVAMVMDKEQVEKQFLDRVELKVRHTSETKEIAGVQCKQAIITDSTDHTYPVYYTSEIALDKPNWCTPFRDIDGLLLEYSIRFGDMVMNLKAREIVNTTNEKSLFEIPKDYEIVKDPSGFNFGF
jgi:hypothetical protein